MATNPIPENIRRLLGPREGDVIAVRIRLSESIHRFPPQYIADNIEDLLDRVANTDWAGEQCDNCGSPGYTIERDPTFPKDFPEGWVARCSGYEYSDQTTPGCNTTYRLGWFNENQVEF